MQFRCCSVFASLVAQEGEADEAVAARGRAGGHAEAARRDAGSHGSPPSDSEARFRHAESLDGRDAFLTKGLGNVRTKMSLAILANNMKRMVHLFGTAKLAEATRA